MISANNDLIKLVIKSIKNDLASPNPVHVNLALQCTANIGSKEMAEGLGNEIPKLLVTGWATKSKSSFRGFELITVLDFEVFVFLDIFLAYSGELFGFHLEWRKAYGQC